MLVLLLQGTPAAACPARRPALQALLLLPVLSGLAGTRSYLTGKRALQPSTQQTDEVQATRFYPEAPPRTTEHGGLGC